jgi:hypothetical protein
MVTTGHGPSIDYGTVAYDASRGNRRWVTHFNAPVNGTDHAAALAVDPAGSEGARDGRERGVSTRPWDLLAIDYATVAYRA